MPSVEIHQAHTPSASSSASYLASEESTGLDTITYDLFSYTFIAGVEYWISSNMTSFALDPGSPKLAGMLTDHTTDRPGIGSRAMVAYHGHRTVFPELVPVAVAIPPRVSGAASRSKAGSSSRSMTMAAAAAAAAAEARHSRIA